MHLKTFIISYLFIYTLRWTFILEDIFTFPQGIIFIFLKVLPPLLFLSLFYQEETKQFFKIESVRELGNMILNSYFISSLVLTTFLIFTQYDVTNIGLKWTWYALATWLIAIFIFYKLFKTKTRKYESFILALLFAKLAGFLYELPIYPTMNPHVGLYFHWSHPFIVDFNWILLPLIIWYLHKHFTIKSKKLFFIALTIYLSGAILYTALNHPIISVQRLPTIIALALIIRSFKPKNKIVKSEAFTPTHLVKKTKFLSTPLTLDVGCGARNRTPVRLDVNRTKAANILGSAYHLPFRDKVFKTVFCYHVLEHLTDPKEALRELCRVGEQIKIKLPLLFYHHTNQFNFKKLGLKWRYGLDYERKRLGIPFRVELSASFKSTEG